MQEVLLILVFAGMFPYWVFGFSIALVRSLYLHDMPTLLVRSCIVGNLATLTSPSYVGKPHGSLCVICGGGTTVRGWPFGWQGREGIDAISAPFALIGSIAVWWGIAALVLWGATAMQHHSRHPRIRHNILPLATACIILSPLLFLAFG